jgi:hypothetical protein
VAHVSKAEAEEREADDAGRRARSRCPLLHHSIGLGRVVRFCTAAHPLCTRFASVSGVSPAAPAAAHLSLPRRLSDNAPGRIVALRYTYRSSAPYQICEHIRCKCL